jgi:hypothetical protein
MIALLDWIGLRMIALLDWIACDRVAGLDCAFWWMSRGFVGLVMMIE